MAEDKNNREINGRGGMLSSTDFRNLVIRQDVPKMKELFRQRKWDDIPDKKFIIDPFNPLNLTPFSYDLSIGDEAFSCRLEGRGSFKLQDSRNDAYLVQPGETVIVRTLEYIALPRCFSGTVWPRFNFVREGMFQSMVKIDPTWYGQLGIALTNLSATEYPIWKGREFATLVLYALTSETDIILYRSGELLDACKKLEVPLDGVQAEELESKIKNIGLEGKCTIEDDKLTIRMALERNEFEKLMTIDDSESWKKVVEKSMRVKTMGALGLSELDLILEKKPKGVRLEREKIAKMECTQQGLLDVAVERGKPFDLIANLPKLVTGQVNEQVQSRIDIEMGKNIIPRMVSIVISLLGFISLIVAIIALLAHYFQWEFPKEIDVKGSLVGAMIVICIALFPVLLYMFSLYGAPKGIAEVKKQLNEINNNLTEKLKAIDNKLLEKTSTLWEEVENIKNRMEPPEV